MWTHRRFTWRYTHVQTKPGARERLDGLAAQLAMVLNELVAQTPQFYRDARIGGMAFGVIEFSVTISDRDRWWVGRRARFLIDAVRRDTDLPLDLVTEETVKLPVHTNRGRWRLRRRAREKENRA